MFKSLRRFAVTSLFTLFAATVLFGNQPVADAGLGTSVGLIANVAYIGEISDLVVSFRLVHRTTGQVMWQADPNDIDGVRTDTDRIRFSTLLVSGWYDYSSTYEWSCRIDARDATSSVYWVDFKQWVDSTWYSSTVPTSNFKGRTSEALLLGEINASYL